MLHKDLYHTGESNLLSCNLYMNYIMILDFQYMLHIHLHIVSMSKYLLFRIYLMDNSLYKMNLRDNKPLHWHSDMIDTLKHLCNLHTLKDMRHNSCLRPTRTHLLDMNWHIQSFLSEDSIGLYWQDHILYIESGENRNI